MIKTIRTKFANVATITAATFSMAIVLMAVVVAQSASADDEPACSKIEVVFARGSGQKLGDGEAKRFSNQMKGGIKAPLTQNFYELGTKKQGGYQYPAVNVGDVRNGNAIGAWLSRGYANDYGESVKQGVYEMIHYMVERQAKCKSAGSKFVLAGYSQGAQVVVQYLNAATATTRSAIAYVALFGDPKLHLPEGEGFNPPACRGEQLSAYRRIIANCDVDNGSLGARKPYLPVDMHSKAGLWCYANDFVCGSSKLAWDMDGHGKYGLDGNAVDSAVYEALQKVRAGLPQEQQQHIPTKRSSGDGTTGLDVMFVIDTTGSMHDSINQAKQFAAVGAARIQALRGRVALVTYRDAGDSYTARIESPLSGDMTDFTAKLQSLSIDGGGDTPEAALHALMTSMNGLSWQNGATKAAILLTDAGFHAPDKVDGTTIDQVARRSLEIDPVNVYPVVPSSYMRNYQSLADLTNGQVITNSGDTEQALFAALTKLEQRPTALLKNQQYRAMPGQQITFDASDSYVDDAEITSFDWDFNGDGVYELHTTNPVAKHAYDHAFDGSMQVRLISSNGTIASASATVKVGAYTAPPVPAAPVDFNVVEDNGNSLVISWRPADTLADSWIVSSDGIALGKVTAGTTTVTVGDLVRSAAIHLEVSGMMADGTVGEHASIVVPPEKTPPQPAPVARPAPSAEGVVAATAEETPWYERRFAVSANNFTDTVNDAPLAGLPMSDTKADTDKKSSTNSLALIGLSALAIMVGSFVWMRLGKRK